MKKWLIYLLPCAAVMLLVIALGAQMRRASAAEAALHSHAVFALSEAAEEVQSLALAVDKLLVSTSRQQGMTLLNETVLCCDRTRHALSGLPAPAEELAPLLSWLASLEDMAQEHLALLLSGQPTPDDRRLALTQMQMDLRKLHAELDLARSETLRGAALQSALSGSAVTPPEATEAPSALDYVQYLALPSEEISEGQAMQLARTFVGESRVKSVSHAPDTSGQLPAIGVTVQTPDLQLNLEITRRGGKVLLMSPETAGFSLRKPPEECIRAAAAFLDDQGFITMTPTFHQVYDGLCTVTFVHEQDGVLCWTDRVLVQVRMDTAEVVGLEAASYWKHHHPRRMPAPLLTEEEARAFLTPQAENVTARLALLNVGGRERLCWQFTFTAADDRFISFIDCYTGQEQLLEKIMQLESGSLAA